MHYLLLILTVLFWAANFVVGRGIHNEIPPIALAFWRWVVALLIILPFSIGHIIRQRDIILKNCGILALMALLSVTNFSMFLYLALNSSPVTNAALINSLTPVYIIIISWFGFNRRISFRQATGIAVSLIGLIFIVLNGNLSALLDIQLGKGDMWTIFAGISWAIYSVLLKKFPQKLHAMGFLTTTIILGLLFIFPFYIWEIGAGKTVKYSHAAIGSIFFIALFPSILSYLFWTMAVRVVGANKAGIFIHLIPVFSIILAIIFLGETLQGYHIKGAFLIFLGIFLTTADQSRFWPSGHKI